MNVMRKNITDETVPMLADEKNVEHMKLHKKLEVISLKYSKLLTLIIRQYNDNP